MPEILCKEHFLSPAGKKPLLVFNDTKVRKARLIGKNEQSGAEAEFLLLGPQVLEAGTVSSPIWKAMVHRAKRRKVGQCYVFFDTEGKEAARAQIVREENEFRFLEFDRPVDDGWLDKHGHIPLPPYIKRDDTPADAQRYQTIYANQTGSAAAPTAGLHFTQEIMEALKEREIEIAFITLHVGLGTFLPVRSENIQDHTMHEEHFIITEKIARQIKAAKNERQKIIAVGTTSLRALESAYTDGNIKQGQSSTSIFIYPGYKFKCINGLITNFHVPVSTLIMLVSAFAGREQILRVYEEAIRERYRFFSFGDAMLIV
jgi:S-adenosylmethionine:tRNA ribosyltransferase-isomerase